MKAGVWFLLILTASSGGKGSSGGQVTKIEMVSQIACERNRKTIKRKLNLNKRVRTACIFTGEFDQEAIDQ